MVIMASGNPPNHISVEMAEHKLSNNIEKILNDYNLTTTPPPIASTTFNENAHGMQRYSHSTDEFDGRRNARAPRAMSELDEDDDDDDDDRDDHRSRGSHPGIDDGLLSGSDSGKRDSGRPRVGVDVDVDIDDKHPPKPRPRRPSFAFPSYDTGVDSPLPDLNAYQHKKTLAQGMMDLALLSANANQLRYVLESYKRHPYYYPSLIFISLSIIFQVAVGVGLILNSRYNIKDEREICRANRINNITVIGIFIVTVVNVFISAFGVADPNDSV